MSITNVFAASSTAVGNDNGLKISPVRTDLTIAPGKSAVLSLYIQNLTPSAAKLQVIINDFTTTGSAGIPALYLKNTNIFNPHSLKQFIAPVGDISLAPGQESTVKVDIKIPTNALGGGYYGAVRFAPANLDSTKSVSLSASVASLILVTVPGPNLREQLNLSSFTVHQNNQASSLFFSSKGLSIVSGFSNTGNVQEEPFGKVTLKNLNGQVILVKEINNAIPAGNVLPSSSRNFSVALSGIGSFGKYTVTGNFGYGTTGQLLSATTTFYVVAPWLIGLIIFIVLLIIFGIWGMPKLFRTWYKRSIKTSEPK